MSIFDKFLNKNSSIEKEINSNHFDALNTSISKADTVFEKVNSSFITGGLNFVLESLFYLLTVCFIVLIFIYPRIVPFDVFHEIEKNEMIKKSISQASLSNFKTGLIVLMVLLALFSFILARMFGSENKQNRLMKNMKSEFETIKKSSFDLQTKLKPFLPESEDITIEKEN